MKVHTLIELIRSIIIIIIIFLVGTDINYLSSPASIFIILQGYQIPTFLVTSIILIRSQKISKYEGWYLLISLPGVAERGFLGEAQKVFPFFLPKSLKFPFSKPLKFGEAAASLFRHPCSLHFSVLVKWLHWRHNHHHNLQTFLDKINYIYLRRNRHWLIRHPNMPL